MTSMTSQALAKASGAADTSEVSGVLGPDMPHRVLIADDHPLMRAALKQAVDRAFPGCALPEAASYDELRALLDAGPEPDLVLLDLHMPGMSGFIGLMMLRSAHPAIPVVVVSAAEDPATVQRSIDYGASGFVPKSAPIAQVGEAIQAVLDGQVWMPEGAGLDDPEAAMADRVVNLTLQQMRVFAGMAEGKLNKQIAWEMAISEQTVKDHVSMILRKLGASNRTQAILLASQLALKPPPALE
jgi:DNA-binding NarL/FixJ family response regulator